MKVGMLLEDDVRPWEGHLAKKAALKFQRELLELDDNGIDISLVDADDSMIHIATADNGRSLTFAQVMLCLEKGTHSLPLLILYSKFTEQFSLYHVDTDFWSTKALIMYDHLLQFAAKVLTEADDKKPWEDHLARKAALKFQQELLDLDDGFEIELVRVRPGMITDAVVNNGMTERFAPFMLSITGSITRDLLIYYQVKGSFALYDVDSDYLGSVSAMVKMLKCWPHPQHKDHGLTEEQTTPSAATILARFAKQLIARGFEAEVKSSSKPGIINSSKQCIEVKGYGMKDSLKLYRPLWKHEKGMVAFVDVKTEQRFSTIPEMVEKLKGKYPKLPKCLSFVPKPEKLKESAGKLKIKQRILKLQTDMIDRLNDLEMSDITKVRARAYGANGKQDTRFDRYVIVIKYRPAPEPDGSRYDEITYVLLIDDLDSVEVDGKLIPPDEGLVYARIFRPKSDQSFKTLQTFDYSQKQLPIGLMPTPEWSSDEAAHGWQMGLTELVDWLEDRLMA